MEAMEKPFGNKNRHCVLFGYYLIFWRVFAICIKLIPYSKINILQPLTCNILMGLSYKHNPFISGPIPNHTFTFGLFVLSALSILAFVADSELDSSSKTYDEWINRFWGGLAASLLLVLIGVNSWFVIAKCCKHRRLSMFRNFGGDEIVDMRYRESTLFTNSSIMEYQPSPSAGSLEEFFLNKKVELSFPSNLLHLPYVSNQTT